MTPLGLNIISPVAPIQFNTSFPSSPVKSFGCSPSGSVPSDFNVAARRGSATSTSSTLTQSRPGPSTSYPAGFNRERRRSSLTPSLPTLAPPSPSRTLASGRISRPGSSDGSGAPALYARARTVEGPNRQQPNGQVMGEGRRGSLPHLNYGGWTTSQRTWNPSLPTQRGSIGEDSPGGDFKFGSGVGEPSAAAAALKAVDVSPSSRRGSFMSSGKRREDMTSFEQAEAEEAERQRRAFLAATYGGDGKRARERLNIGSPSGITPAGSPGTPGSATLRRQSLMLWERMNMSAMSVKPEGDAAISPPPIALPYPTFLLEPEFGARRGSSPIAIPGGSLGKSPSRRAARLADMDAPPKSKEIGDEEEEDDEEDDEEEELTRTVSSYIWTMLIAERHAQRPNTTPSTPFTTI